MMDWSQLKMESVEKDAEAELAPLRDELANALADPTNIDRASIEEIMEKMRDVYARVWLAGLLAGYAKPIRMVEGAA